MQQGGGDDLAVCLSFKFYLGTDGIAAIAAKVSRECIAEEETDDVSHGGAATADLDHHGEEFEFALEFGNESFPADDEGTVHDGDDQVAEDERFSSSTKIRIPSEKLFIGGNREEAPISSSSPKANKTELIVPSRACFQRWPKPASSSPDKRKKSRSTGSSSGSFYKNIRDLLRRFNNKGKVPVKSVTPKEEAKKTEKRIVKLARIASGNAQKTVSSAQEVFYIRNRREKQVGKRKSYLPYRPDLLTGLFARTNIGMIKNLPF